MSRKSFLQSLVQRDLHSDVVVPAVLELTAGPPDRLRRETYVRRRAFTELERLVPTALWRDEWTFATLENT